MKAKTIFRVAQFKNTREYPYSAALDYPQNLPLPRIGETVLYNDYNGIVIDVRHGLQKDLANTSIIIDCGWPGPIEK